MSAFAATIGPNIATITKTLNIAAAVLLGIFIVAFIVVETRKNVERKKRAKMIATIIPFLMVSAILNIVASACKIIVLENGTAPATFTQNLTDLRFFFCTYILLLSATIILFGRYCIEASKKEDKTDLPQAEAAE